MRARRWLVRTAAAALWRSSAARSWRGLAPESTRHRHAFDVYLRLGADRSLELLHAALVKAHRAPTLRTLCTWSGRYGWQQRIAEFELRARQADEAAYVSEVHEACARRKKLALFLEHKGLEALESKSLAEISAATAVRVIELGIRTEREAMGEPGKEDGFDMRAEAEALAAEEGLNVEELLHEFGKISKQSKRRR